jgi:hypothetical protein
MDLLTTDPVYARDVCHAINGLVMRVLDADKVNGPAPPALILYQGSDRPSETGGNRSQIGLRSDPI